MDRGIQKKVIIRLTISMIVAFLFGFLVSELSFRALIRNTEREVEDILITVPIGTAERVEKGYPVPSIPESMVFFEGDRIIVQNNDVVSHQLGPIWVPAGSSGILALEKPQTYTLSCSFQANNVMGLEVRPRLTNNIRFQGIIAIGLPSGILIWLFSLIAIPLDPKPDQEVIND